MKIFILKQDSTGSDVTYCLEEVGGLVVEDLGVTLEASGVKDEGGDDVGVDVGGGAAVLEVAARR